MDENITPIPVDDAETAIPVETEEIPTPPKKLGMKWHGFLCFWLPFTGIMGIISSIFAIIITSLDIGYFLDVHSTVYIVSEYMQNIMLLVFSILMILAWVGLHKFRKGAPKFFLLQTGLYTLIMSVPNFISNLALGIPVAEALLLLLPSYIFKAVYLWLNHIYFRKRAHLYVN